MIFTSLTSLRRTGMLVLAAVLTTTLVVAPVFAEELEEGFVLTEDNLEEHLDDTFEGHTIRSLLTKALRRRIEGDGQKVKLKNYPPFDISDKFQQATEAHADEVGYNPGSKMIEDYTAGLPFPDVEDQDAYSGIKSVYNHWWGAPLFHFASDPSSHTLLIDGEDGLERKLVSTAQQYRFINQWEHMNTDEPLVEGSGGIHSRGLFFVRFPQDLRGIGTFAISYTTGRLSDAWVYVRSLRRVRRVSGGNWMSRAPGGLDAYGDSLQGPVQHPSWYPGFEYLGTRTILSPRREPGTLPSRQTGSGQEYEYQALETDEEPHWNWNPEYVGYEPRKVHVVRMRLPEAHTLGERIVYYDDVHWMQTYAEEYDKNGKLSQFVSHIGWAQKGPEGTTGANIWAQTVINWKAYHASVFTINRKPTVNADVESDCISLDQLRLAEPCTP